MAPQESSEATDIVISGLSRSGDRPAVCVEFTHLGKFRIRAEFEVTTDLIINSSVVRAISITAFEPWDVLIDTEFTRNVATVARRAARRGLSGLSSEKREERGEDISALWRGLDRQFSRTPKAKTNPDLYKFANDVAAVMADGPRDATTKTVLEMHRDSGKPSSFRDRRTLKKWLDECVEDGLLTPAWRTTPTLRRLLKAHRL